MEEKKLKWHRTPDSDSSLTYYHTAYVEKHDGDLKFKFVITNVSPFNQSAEWNGRIMLAVYLHIIGENYFLIRKFIYLDTIKSAKAKADEIAKVLELL